MKPDQILMVVDAMTGQDVVNVAAGLRRAGRFRRRDHVEDGRRRPWRRRAVAQARSPASPSSSSRAGEKPDSLEPFHPDRMAKRILGMGDVVSLIEHASKIQARRDDEAETAERVRKADINLNDFLEIKNRQVSQDGRHLASSSARCPAATRPWAQGQVDTGALDRMEAIINSMTKAEREKPELLNGSRRQRIAAGSGTVGYRK